MARRRRRGRGGAMAHLHPNVRIGTVAGRGRLQEGSRGKGSLKGKRGLKGGQHERAQNKSNHMGSLGLWGHKPMGAVQWVRLKM